MSKLQLLYPVNNHPFTINQAWGIYNPAYQKFGFDHHNGIDLPMPSDKTVYCPVRARVTMTPYYPNGGGYQLNLITTEKWNVGGVDCYVFMVFMHNEKFLVNTGDIVEVGTPLTVPDNTGFSTGPHIHFGCYRLMDDQVTYMDKNDANGSFDPMPYFTGDYAQLNSKMKKLVVLLQTYLNKLLNKWILQTPSS